MRVFDFTLLSGYEFSGVDVAQGFRARLFAKNNVNAKFIFTELPTIRDIELYGSQKIKRSQIMSAHLFMTGRLDMSLSVKKEALLENEKENYEYDYIDENGKGICLYNSSDKLVEILCDEDGFVINESLFKNGKKYLVNYYTDSLSYTELYNWDNDSSDGLNPERRIFWNKQGQMVYEQCIYKDKVEYLFKNGEVIDNVAFIERFVKALDLCENDACIMDRAGYLDYIQPLFDNKGKSKLIAVLHSDHFYKIYEDESSLYMNYEYYYWFKYSEAIDYFVVGTDEHKRGLEAFLKEYSLLEDCGFTRAEAVRATGQLVMRNIENVLEAGCDGALTGPIERNDIETVKKHIACMQNDDSDDVSLYKMLGTKLVNIAEKKNPDKEYTQMMELLRG